MSRNGMGPFLNSVLRSAALASFGLAVCAASLIAQAKSAPPDLTDSEVAHVAVTANKIDIAAAGIAQSKAVNAQVRQFAATMITDHTAVNSRAAALALRLGVTPEDNAVSRSLMREAAEVEKRLQALSGAEFERAYLDREVAYHQAVVDAIDNVLVPTTENAELKKLLTEVRPAIVAHLEHARQIRASLGGDER